MMYGLRWNETNNNDQVVTKERDFNSEEERAKFIDSLENKDNFIEVVAYSNPEGVEPERTAATKTSGVFKVTSTETPEFSYIGASSQIEIAFRDYMNWVTKGKAPKAIQEEADRFDRNPGIFNYEVLEEINGSRAELNSRKKFWKGEQLTETEDNRTVDGTEPEQEQEPEETVEELTIEQRNERIMEQLEEGKSVVEVAEAFGVSKSTVYNVRSQN